MIVANIIKLGNNNMENKINIAELLKDCPKGMELDCTMWDSEAKVFLKEVSNGNYVYPIEVIVKYDNIEYLKSFTKYGAFNDLPYCKCVIFPKGKTTWEGFVAPPCKFKDGDIIYNRLQKRICIYHYHYREEISTISHCRYNEYCKTFEILDNDICIVEQDYRLATEEERQRLFDAIKANGYKWNTVTKTLEKLIQSKFKVGDRIRHKTANKDNIYEISKVYDDSYGLVDFTCMLDMKYQDNYELVPNKFDITTLIPFESKVLVRDSNRSVWNPSFWGCRTVEEVNYRYNTVRGTYAQCIPYEGNEFLLGTTNDCDEYYKTWK